MFLFNIFSCNKILIIIIMKYIFIIFFILCVILIKYLYPISNISESFESDNQIESLRTYFNSMSSNKKIFLSQDYETKKYNRFDIDPQMERFIKELISPYIRILNLNLNYDFIINHISNISEEIDNNKNRKYIIDFFMYEQNNFFVSRVIIDLILLFNGKKYLNSILLADAEEKYNEKISTESIRGKQISEYKNEIEGINLSCLDFTKIDSNPYEDNESRKSLIRNKWILPKNAPKICSIPCKTQSDYLNKYDVLYSFDNSNFTGVNTSHTSTKCYPSYNPTITGLL